jgi:hypothetical protein
VSRSIGALSVQRTLPPPPLAYRSVQPGHIVQLVARERVIQLVPCAHRRRACRRQQQVLHVRHVRQAEADRRNHRVDEAFQRLGDDEREDTRLVIGNLFNHVTGVIDMVGVVTGSAPHGIRTTPPVEHVRAIAADQRVCARAPHHIFDVEQPVRAAAGNGDTVARFTITGLVSLA